MQFAHETAIVVLLLRFLGLGLRFIAFDRGRLAGRKIPGRERQAAPAAREVLGRERVALHHGAVVGGAEAQPDVAVLFQLLEPEQALARAFERRHHRGHARDRAGVVGEELAQTGLAARFEVGDQGVDARAQRHVVADDGARAEAADARHQQVEGGEQLPGVELAEVDAGDLVGILRDLLAQPPGQALQVVAFALLQDLRRLLEAAEGEQPADQIGARIAPVLLVHLLDRAEFGRRRDGARLHLQQRRRHDQEVAGDLQVEAVLPLGDDDDELVRDGRDADVGDLDLAAPDEEQQQVHRPAEHLEGDGEAEIGRFRARACRGWLVHLVGRHRAAC